MKRKYLKYYESYSALAGLFFLKDALLTRAKVRKLSLFNRQQDYLRLNAHPELLPLHRDLNRLLLEAEHGWGCYDYGEGYFYQSLARVGITGLRDTESRLREMELERFLEGKSVLEIGCNSGFLSLSLAEFADRIVAFDINPHLIAIAQRVSAHLALANVDFFTSSFEDYSARHRFEAVLSFANHSTYDGNTKQSLEKYFSKCFRYTEPGGLFLFESHPPEHEGDGLDKVCTIIGRRFHIQQRRITRNGSLFDRGRTFIVARRPEAST